MPFNIEVKKVHAKLRGHFSRIFTNQRRNDTPLIMTLLVRNEEDIIQANIDHHFSQGVDFIIATDNASTDNTREVLERYQQQGRLHIIDEPSFDYAQSTWVNRMAEWAFANKGPCFMFHADADEFWSSRSGSLKNELSLYPLIDCLEVHIKNVLLAFNDYKEKFPADAVHCVERPYPAGDIQEQTLDTSMYLFPYPTKVFFRVKNSTPLVKMGNHELDEKNTYSRAVSRDIYVYHFPVRSYEQFKRKVVEGGSAIISNPNLAPGYGWHWRRWYKAYKENRLQEEYRMHVLNTDEAESLIDADVVTPIEPAAKITQVGNTSPNMTAHG